ncbi:Hypothetical predicted protein [Paramuricea clavata]|uniref:Uncharacterized protein n=1 Tax=Paramuricea clavata TaxID=317549 RepID=A0A6S7I7J0_PARCT|nr:Hypothetical predicted protein [Paramuricea clavata]
MDDKSNLQQLSKCLNDASNLINTMLDTDTQRHQPGIAPAQPVPQAERPREAAVNVPSVRATINSAVDRARLMIGQSSSRGLCSWLNRRERLRVTSSKPSTSTTKKPRLEKKVFEFVLLSKVKLLAGQGCIYLKMKNGLECLFVEDAPGDGAFDFEKKGSMQRFFKRLIAFLDSHNKSPHDGDCEGELNNSRQESRESERCKERYRSQSHSSRRCRSRQRSRSNDREETIPGWAQQLLNGQRESDQRLKTLEKQLKDTNAKQSYARKWEHSPTPEFKYKRNKVQYELNKSILGKIETALDASDDEERSGALDEGREMLIERNKHIKLAEKYGWEAVDCYIDEP